MYGSWLNWKLDEWNETSSHQRRFCDAAYVVLIDEQLVPGLHSMQLAAYVFIVVAFVANALPQNPADVFSGVTWCNRRRHVEDAVPANDVTMLSAAQLTSRAQATVKMNLTDLCVDRISEKKSRKRDEPSAWLSFSIRTGWNCWIVDDTVLRYRSEKTQLAISKNTLLQWCSHPVTSLGSASSGETDFIIEHTVL